MSNSEALREFLAARPSVSPLLAELARSMAAAIDDAPDAAMAKQYQALVERLLADDASGSEPGLGDLFSEVGDPA